MFIYLLFLYYFILFYNEQVLLDLALVLVNNNIMHCYLCMFNAFFFIIIKKKINYLEKIKQWIFLITFL